MSENNLYYIYIDTKIEGTIDQLVNYFQTRVFTNAACISVICKSYKEIDGYIIKRFKENNIPYQFFKKYSEIKFQENKVVFYLFNAQSNCRIVANRKLVHVFVTHGESNKLASIKPIIRIYDFVITSGQLGIDRYLKAGIFNQQDVDNKRIICMGDTFIGDNSYEFSSESDALLYAPTWEGGVPDENYSSISMAAAEFILNIANSKNISTIFIQPHPNLGHRDKKYFSKIKTLILFLLKNGKKVILRSDKRLGVLGLFCLIHRVSHKKTDLRCKVNFAITDISAMEVQLISKNIPVYVLENKNSKDQYVTPKKILNYYNLIENDQNLLVRCLDIDQISKDYIFSYTLKDDLERDKQVIFLSNYLVIKKNEDVMYYSNQY